MPKKIERLNLLERSEQPGVTNLPLVSVVEHATQAMETFFFKHHGTPNFKINSHKFLIYILISLFLKICFDN